MYHAEPKYEIGCLAIAVAALLAIGFFAGRLTASEPEPAPEPSAVSPFLPPPPTFTRDRYGFEGIAPRGGRVR